MSASARSTIYQQIAPAATLEELRWVAKDLQGARIP